MFFQLLLLLIGVFACSTAVIFIKVSQEQVVWLAAERLLIAAVALTPLMIRDWRRHHERLRLRDLTHTIGPGVILALHFITWLYGARLATSANASLLVNLVPIAMPFFLYFMLRERITRRELTGTGIALLGVAILGAGDLNLSAEYLKGDLICLFSMLLFCVYLVYGRKTRTIKSIWLYMTPIYFISGLTCAAVALLTGMQPLGHYPPLELAMIFSLGIVPTIFGHTLLNHALQNMRGQIVSIVNELQFVFAGVTAYFVLGEVPQWTFYIAGALVMGGMVVVLQKHEPDRMEVLVEE
jgi:drug/metabolite transporter (DMT)-like permease